MRHPELLFLGLPVADKLIRTVVVYLGIALALRLAGKRDLAQLNSFDLVVTLLLANVVQNAIIGPDDSLAGGLLGVAILLTLNAWAVWLFEGAGTPLVKDGRYIESALRREGLRKADIEVALRQQNANGLEEVAEATLTPGGAIIVWLRPQNMAARRIDVEALRDRIDEPERRLSNQLDALLTRGDPISGAGSPGRNTSTAAETASETMQ